MTIIEKILARASGRKKTSPGEYVTAKIDMAMMPEMFRLLKTVIARGDIREEDLRIWDPERFVVVIDHRVPPAVLANAENQKTCREFAKTLGIKHFFDIFPGIGHQVMVEKGFVRPGELIVGADSHTTTYGALNAAATGIGTSDMAYVVYTGELWFRVPETIKVDVHGRLPDFVHSKDVILYIAGKYTTEVAQYKAIEWTGSGVDEMSLDSRLTMGNMSVELGAKFGIFRADQKVVDYVRSRTDKPFEPVESDPEAVYAEKYHIDAPTLEPQVALPHNVGNVVRAREVKDIKIDQAVIASCCHGRIEDLEIAVKILKGKKVHPEVRFYVAPASWEIYKEASDKGLLSRLIESGVMIGNPSCGFCTGLQGLLAKGEKCIAATPRNFKGRMGSPEAEIYLG
ncbi:MAG: aconitase/3-isopropylmalate dehydratase large subunit family protein, partial [Deltaproteobacteria bacterium]